MEMRRYLILFSVAALLSSAVCPAGDLEDSVAAYKRGDYKTALAIWTQAANKGVAEAQHNLGTMYEYGQGVGQDYKQAALWYRKAADQEHAAAQSNLGGIYKDGRGVEQDYKQAAFWYRKAADQGLAPAQYNLGIMYGQGRGVEQDYVQAHKWFTLAAANTTDKNVRDVASSARDIAARMMTDAQITEAARLAREWKKR